MADLLVVDDDADLAELAALVLESAGHTVRQAFDGAEGLRLLGDRHPDALVLDVEMPRLSGPGMVHRMLLDDAGRERIPVILVSGVVDLAPLAAQVGTPYVLAKPVSADDLLAMVDRALGERLPPRPGSGTNGLP